MADNVVRDFQRTDEMAVNRDFARNNAAAISAAGSGRGGALAFRNAIGAAQNANVDALAQAGITRANETNQLINTQGNLIAQGAGIRQSMLGQDQQAASLAGNLGLGLGAQQQSAMDSAGQFVNNATQAQFGAVDARQAAANATTNAGLRQQEQFLQAQLALEGQGRGQRDPGKSRFQQVVSGIFDPINLRGASGGGIPGAPFSMG